MQDKTNYKEICDLLASISELTNRTDERIKILIEDNIEHKEKMEKLADKLEENSAKLFFLEKKVANGMSHEIIEMKSDIKESQIKLSTLEVHTDLHQGKWRSVGDLIFQITITIIGAILTVISGIILWKLGVKP